MYPGPEAPDLGVFVKQIADALEQEGNELERVVIWPHGRRLQRGGSGRKRSTPTSCSPQARPERWRLA